MADIRLSGTIKDDFNRADENPVASPWAQANAGVWAAMRIEFSQIGGTAIPPTASGAYWSTQNWDNDEAEIWATFVGTISAGEDVRMGLMRDDGVAIRDGYTFHHGWGPYWEIRRYDNGTGTQLVIDNPSSQGMTEGDMCLIRRNGADIEGWFSDDDGANWTMLLSATDTNYTTALYGMLGAGGNAMGWDNFGAGPGRHIPQIYRLIRGR